MIPSETGVSFLAFCLCCSLLVSASAQASVFENNHIWEIVKDNTTENAHHGFSVAHMRMVNDCMMSALKPIDRRDNDLYYTQPSELKDMHNYMYDIRKLDKRKILFIGDSVMDQQFVCFVCLLNSSYRFQYTQLHSERHIPLVFGQHDELTVTAIYLPVGKAWSLIPARYLGFSHLSMELAVRKAFSVLGPADVLVVNQGLHHNFHSYNDTDAKTLQKTAMDLVEVYSEFCRSHLNCSVPRVIWRETTPQYFKQSCNGMFGIFDKRIARRGGCYSNLLTETNITTEDGSKCLPLNARNELTNPIILSTRRKSNFAKPIFVSSIFDLLTVAAPKGMMWEEKGDCTHLGTSMVIFMTGKLIELIGCTFDDACAAHHTRMFPHRSDHSSS